VDIEGNVYRTVQIGGQIWMAENLNVNHFRDGSLIVNITDNAEWSSTTSGAFSYYSNDKNHVDIYGTLYNWYAVNGDIDGDGIKDKELAPEGWHIPTDEEWTELENYLGGSSIAGMKLKSTNGWFSDGNGTDDVGFTALPGGYRLNNDYYNYQGYRTLFWSATEYYSSLAWYRRLYFSSSDVYRNYYGKENGFSVRCVRD